MKKKFRIGVNLLHVVPEKVGGSEEYSVQVLRALKKHELTEIEPILFVLDSFRKAHPDLCETFETVICKIDGENRFKRIIAESTWLKFKSRGCDGIHHFGGRLPLLSMKPNAVTIHDLQPLEKPLNFSLLKRILFRHILPSTIRKAGVLVAVSEPVKEKITKCFNLDSRFVHVVTTGIEKVEEKPNNPKEPPTIFYPAATYPHKNHQVLIDAFNQLAQIDQKVCLVMSGGPGRSDKEIKKLVLISPVKERIFLTGRVSLDEFKTILKDSTLLAFPSTYEGFGIPVLEAMAAGVPVVVAKGTPAEKLPGEKSLRVEPYDVAGWVEALESLLKNTQLRTEIAEENIDLAKNYNWDASAGELIFTWKKIISLKREKNCAS